MQAWNSVWLDDKNMQYFGPRIQSRCIYVRSLASAAADEQGNQPSCHFCSLHHKGF